MKSRKIKKSKKITKVKASKKQIKKQSVEVVVRVAPQELAITPKESDLLPIQSGTKYMIPKTWLSEKQVIQMVQKTPPQHVYQRPGKGGQVWNYVTGNYVEKVLNFTFGWNWDFEIVAHGKEGDLVWVHGKLTVKSPDGRSISKSQFGRADIKYIKGTQRMLDYGNDLKSASTDALKKCASLLGIASDIYGKTEIKQETGKEITPTAQPVQHTSHSHDSQSPIMKPGQVEGPDGYPTYICNKCDDPISDQTAEYSLKVFGKRLCREDQPKKR